jgi:hypothetical protein
LAAIGLIVPAFAQEPQPMPQGPGMKMKGMREDMQAEMIAMDEKLDKLVTDMNTAATPDKKIDATIAVINEIVAQHKKIHEKMTQRWEEHRRHEPDASPKKQ